MIVIFDDERDDVIMIPDDGSPTQSTQNTLNDCAYDGDDDLFSN